MLRAGDGREGRTGMGKVGTGPSMSLDARPRLRTLPPVAAHDPTDHAPPLRDPMVLTHPYLHSDARFFCSYVLEACQQPDQGRASSSASVAESCMPSVVWV